MRSGFNGRQKHLMLSVITAAVSVACIAIAAMTTKGAIEAGVNQDHLARDMAWKCFTVPAGLGLSVGLGIVYASGCADASLGLGLAIFGAGLLAGAGAAAGGGLTAEFYKHVFSQVEHGFTYAAIMGGLIGTAINLTLVNCLAAVFFDEGNRNLADTARAPLLENRGALLLYDTTKVVSQSTPFPGS